MAVSPGDMATDHAVLFAVVGVVGAVEGEVAQRGDLGLDEVGVWAISMVVGAAQSPTLVSTLVDGWGEKLSQSIAIRTSAGSRPFIEIPSDGPGRSLQQIAGNLLGGVGEAGGAGFQVDAGCPSGEADRVVPPAQQESVE